jgi:predicted RNase H-like HicB family nuclease
METIQYTVKIQPAAEGGYWAEVPALPGCFSQGESLEEVTGYVREAIECHLLNLSRQGTPFPIEKRSRRGFEFLVSVRPPRSA